MLLNTFGIKLSKVVVVEEIKAERDLGRGWLCKKQIQAETDLANKEKE